MSNSLESLKKQRDKLSAYQPSDGQTPLDHLMFERWATVPMIRIVKILSCKPKKGVERNDLFSTRSIAVMIDKSLGTTTTAVKKLITEGYIVELQGKYTLNLNVVFEESSERVSDQYSDQQPINKLIASDQKTDRGDQKTDRKRSEFRSHNINNKYNKKNISKECISVASQPTPPAKKNKTVFKPKTSISGEDYKIILTSEKYCNNDKNYFNTQLSKFYFWTQEGNTAVNWSSRFKRWILQERHSYGQHPTKKRLDGQTFELPVISEQERLNHKGKFVGLFKQKEAERKANLLQQKGEA